MFFGCRGDYSGFGGDFLESGDTASFFRAIQVDPRSEDSAGPQFVAASDVNNDGLVDLVSAWNQSQPVQVHIQRRSGGSITFETVTLAGNIPVIRVAGLVVADFDGDDHPDVAVLAKETGLSAPECLDSENPGDGDYTGLIILYLAPSDVATVTQALAWQEVVVESSRLGGGASTGPPGPPEEEGFTSMAVGDINLDDGPDLVVAWNPGGCNGGIPETLLFTNLGPAGVRDGSWTAERIPDAFEKGPLLEDEPGLPSIRVKDVKLTDVDGDGDTDIVATYPDAASLNVRWYRNPRLDVPDDVHASDGNWQTGVVGQVSPKDNDFADLGGADAIQVGDIDGDGIPDVAVRSTGGAIVQWLKGPTFPTSLTAPVTSGSVRQIPWQVYTLAEYTEGEPRAIALGDLTDDGRPELIASAGGSVAFYNADGAPSIFDQWPQSLIVNDDTGSSPTDPSVPSEVIAGGTFINSILVVDVDGDGNNDLVATLDRSGLSGLSNDALVWFQNTGP